MSVRHLTLLGAGIAGISAGFHARQNGNDVILFEQDADWGGLCGNFTIDGFRFDRFVHLSFATGQTAEHFAHSAELRAFSPQSWSYYRGAWLRHPAQTALWPLKTEEKIRIIEDFVNRPPLRNPKDYAKWLVATYGTYFARHFVFPYTRKYWGLEAAALNTAWIGERMYPPSLAEILRGAFEAHDENFYYVQQMRYPQRGGYRAILDAARQGLDIRCNKRVVEIDVATRTLRFADGSHEHYDTLVSTLPLPEMARLVTKAPQRVKTAAAALHHTSGYQVSFGFSSPDIAQRLWFYVYDEDLAPARVYSPSLKSPDNVPVGKSAYQAEVFFDNHAPVPDPEATLEKTEKALLKMGICGSGDIVLRDIRFEKYANVTFAHGIERNRGIVREWLASLGILSIGRFGRWDYLWSHQAFEDGARLFADERRGV